MNFQYQLYFFLLFSFCVTNTWAQQPSKNQEVTFVRVEQDSLTGLGFLTTKEAYAFDGETWQSIPINGLGSDIVGSQGILGVLTTKEAYAFDGKKWYSIETKGLEVDIIATNGVIGVLTNKEAYAFDGKKWHTAPVDGLVNGIWSYKGSIMVLTTKMAYHFNKKTQKWTTTTYNGLFSDLPK